MSRVAYDLEQAADECAELASLGNDGERFGEFEPEVITRVRTRAAIAPAAAAESMRDERMLQAQTVERMGQLTMAGLRSPQQLEADAEWCRVLGLVVSSEAHEGAMSKTKESQR